MGNTKKFHPLYGAVFSCCLLGNCIIGLIILKTLILKKKSFGFPDSNPFLSFIVALIEIRNICAHHGRLWNKSLMKKPETIRNLATTNDYITSCLPIVPSGKLFEIVLLMINSLRMINPSTSWPARLGELLLELEDWQLIEMGFPQERETWKQLIV